MTDSDTPGSLHGSDPVRGSKPERELPTEGSKRSVSDELRRFDRAARRATQRLRFNAALAAAVKWLPLPLAYAAGALTYVKLAKPPHETILILGAIAALLLLAVLGIFIVRWVRASHLREGALAIDRYHGLDDRLTTALEFSQLPDSERTPLMELAVADAAEKAPRLEPRRAVPFRFPAGGGFVMGLTVGLGVLALLEVRWKEPVPPPRAAAVEHSVLLPDDVELLRDQVDELAETTETAEAQEAVRRFNHLVEDLAEKKLSRREAFARLADLERQLEGAAREGEALDEALGEMARELEKASLSKPTAEALEQNRLKDAEKALRKLAERLRNQETPPTKEELAELRKSLEKASQTTKHSQEKLDSERSQLEAEQKRLLQKKQDGTATPSELQKLERNRRQLERLGRKQKQQQTAQKEMSELDKQLAEAARQLQQEQKKRGSEFLDQGAEAMEQMAQKQLTTKEKKELLQKLREMREMLRQQKQGPGQQNRSDRMRRFSKKARGGKQPGQGQGKPGQRGQGRRQLVFGQRSVPMPAPGAGQRPGQGNQPGQGQQPGGDGRKPGSGHDPSLQGDASQKGKFDTHDVMAVAPDTGQGTASSETIYGAAQRGFSSGDYKKIYTDYKTVAEDVIEREEVPPGYRFYVRRYFQLIRPRE